MTEWIDLGRELPWLGRRSPHFANEDAEPALVARLAALGFRAAVLDGNQIHDEASFFAELARVLGFPSYFGCNWDAVVDCMGDLHHLDQSTNKRRAILWRHASQSLAVAPDLVIAATHGLCAIAEDHGRDGDPAQLEIVLLGQGPGFGARPQERA